MPARPHVVRRQILEVEVEGTESDGLALQRRLPALCQDWLMPSLEAVFDRVVPEDEYWRIERLDIDAGNLRPETFESTLVDVVTQGVERYLREHAPRRATLAPPALADRKSVDGSIAHRTEGQSLHQAFLYFLQTGALPWWFHLPQQTTLEDVIRESWEAGVVGRQPRDFAAALTGLIANATVRARLVRQFSPEFLHTLLAAKSSECDSAVRHILEELTQAGIATRGFASVIEHVWVTAFVTSASGERPTADTLMVDVLSSAPPGTDWPKTLPSRFARLRPAEAPGRAVEKTIVGREAPRTGMPTPRGPRAKPSVEEPHNDLDEGVYVNCAGMVLLHPFLPRLFEAVGIASDGTLLQPERALHLMHFLATGQRVAPEYELLLPKVLCDVPLETCVNARIELSAAEEDEATALLAAVIQHWDALGDTSADGLRNTFLLRTGKLSRRGGDDLLQVEGLSFDILLDRLPWSIGMIQLPWMKRMLHVEWRF